MIQTTYTCDKCGAKQDTADQMWLMAVSVAYWGESYPSKKVEALWCRVCVEKMGLLPVQMAKKEDVVDPPPTIEQLIREIVRAELEVKK